jgi:hypothetical protein
MRRQPLNGASKRARDSAADQTASTSATAHASETAGPSSHSPADNSAAIAGQSEGDAAEKLAKRKKNSTPVAIPFPRNAFKKRIQNYKIKNIEKIADPLKFLSNVTVLLNNVVDQTLNRHSALKINLILIAKYHRNEGLDVEEFRFKTPNTALYQGTDRESFWLDLFENLITEMLDFEAKGSGWSLFEIKYLLLHTSKYRPLRGSSYVKLPKEAGGKSFVINTQNYNDHKCFYYAMLAKFAKYHPHLVASFKNIKHNYNFDNIPWPLPVEKIGLFENQNPEVSINVFALDENCEYYPMRVVKEVKADHRNLLYLTKNGTSHYAYITNFDCFIRSQLTKSNGRIYTCPRCFTFFKENGEMRLADHTKHCMLHSPTRVEMPRATRDGPPIMSFKNYSNQMELPFVIVADIESILMPEQNCSPDPTKSYTLVTEHHKAMSVGCKIITNVPSEFCAGIQTNVQIFEGDNCVKDFVRYASDVSRTVAGIYKRVRDMNPMTSEEIRVHETAEVCSICDIKFKKSDVRCRDHCHISGKYRGAAHSKCNLNYKLPNFLPIYFHNNSRYDAHFIFRELNHDPGEITVLAQSEETYISYSKKVHLGLELRYLDSYRLLSDSLDQLAKTIDDENMLTVKQNFPGHDFFTLARRKGVFPYNYITDYEVLQETKLPSKDKFFNKLTNKAISDAEYSHAHEVWQKFGIKNILEYSRLYLKMDVCLLSDVLSNFRKLCLQHYKLDPCYYYTIPGLSLDACLRITNVKIELLTDYTTYLIFENNIRGGSTQLVQRYFKANDPRSSEFDPSQPKSHILITDANSLYGTSLMKKLPISDFRRLETSELAQYTTAKIMSMDGDGDLGYIFIVTIDYPDHLHEEHESWPFLAEKMAPPGSKHKKLLTTLYGKKEYGVYLPVLQQAISYGLLLRTVHGAVEFKQSAWMLDYIMINAELRSKATSKFAETFFKYMVNSVYGKCLENVRKYKNIKIVTSAEELDKLVSLPTFEGRIIYDENLAAVLLKKESMYVNKPIFVGWCVLETSKLFMYNFYYGVMRPHFHGNITAIYGDTDSFFFIIRCENIEEELKKLGQYFDFSNYEKSHPLYSNKNERKYGFFKDECAGKIVIEWVALRAKAYAVRFEYQKYKYALKGVGRSVVGSEITFRDYLRCFREDVTIRATFKKIVSRKHRVYTEELNKVALSPLSDSQHDKRFVLPDSIHTLPFGHMSLRDADNV